MAGCGARQERSSSIALHASGSKQISIVLCSRVSKRYMDLFSIHPLQAFVTHDKPPSGMVPLFCCLSWTSACVLNHAAGTGEPESPPADDIYTVKVSFLQIYKASHCRAVGMPWLRFHCRAPIVAASTDSALVLQPKERIYDLLNPMHTPAQREVGKGEELGSAFRCPSTTSSTTALNFFDGRFSCHLMEGE
eukprot:1498312-Amphidinium_carterae.1